MEKWKSAGLEKIFDTKQFYYKSNSLSWTHPMNEQPGQERSQIYCRSKVTVKGNNKIHEIWNTKSEKDSHMDRTLII